MRRNAPLVRRTPLRRGGPLSRKPQRDPVSPELAIRVFERDGYCVAAQIDPEHTCWGRLTPEHVPERGRNAYGKRAPSDDRHLIALCLGANSGGLRPWAETHRDAEREYLASLYGAAS